MVANVQNVTDLSLLAPKIFDLRANLLLKFLKLLLAWNLKSFIGFLAVDLCLKGSSLKAQKITLVMGLRKNSKVTVEAFQQYCHT